MRLILVCKCRGDSVLQRSQYWDQGGFVEGFTYDALNRLETSTIGVTEQRTTYDAVGNITSKTGLGNYVYPAQGAGAVRPHAVQAIGGIAGGFVYDNNGNLTVGAGRSALWTTFDMPTRITKNTAIADFVYGPEHQRVRQIRSDGSTIVYAGAQEVEVGGNGGTVKTYWPLGVGVEIDRPGASSPELNWTQLDRLGSPVAVTDATGTIREKLEYDAWGKRRSTGDHVATPDSLDGVTDNRGFTGHEMLDQLDLVHMNGRIYDPAIGRFMSGDPIIQEPMSGQNYNRYSYVSNNPTNLVDPTGFLEEPTGGVEEKSTKQLTLLGGNGWVKMWDSSGSGSEGAAASPSQGTASGRGERQERPTSADANASADNKDSEKPDPNIPTVVIKGEKQHNVAVVFGGRSPGNPFGHVALAIEKRGVTSFGTGTAPRSSLTDYINKQSEYRSTTVYIIKRTNSQIKGISDSLRAMEDIPLPSFINHPDQAYDTCASRCNEALSKGGLFEPRDPVGSSLFGARSNMPASTADIGRENASEIVRIPRGQAAPSSLSIFNPAKDD